MTTQLPDKFLGTGEVKGIVFTKIDSNEHAYLFLVENFEAKTIYYEVFERRVVAVCIDFEKRIYSETDFKEIYPKANDFGVWAWTNPDYSKALKKFEEITVSEIAKDKLRTKNQNFDYK